MTYRDIAPWTEIEIGEETVDASVRNETTLRLVVTVLCQFLADAGLTSAEPIGPNTLVVNIGADSVALLQVHTLLEDALGGAEIPTSALFDYPSVGELADYLATLA